MTEQAFARLMGRWMVMLIATALAILAVRGASTDPGGLVFALLCGSAAYWFVAAAKAAAATSADPAAPQTRS